MVGGETKFACVDGPEFDGHQVDFDELMARQATYVAQEKQAYDACKEHKKQEVRSKKYQRNP